jgi:hypothetical protein
LPVVAEAVYKGFIVQWIDTANTSILDSMRDAPKELPTILTFSEIDGRPMFCCDGKDMDADNIRIWATDVLIS